MQRIIRLIQNKKFSNSIFWILSFLVMISNHIPFLSDDYKRRDIVQYLVLAVVIIWAAIYNLVPKQETKQELYKRHKNMVWIVLAVITAFLIAKLCDQVYFLPKLNELKKLRE